LKKFKIKICGIRKKTTIECCLKNKIQYFGLVFYEKSPRYIDINKSIELIKFAKNKPITPVGVFFNRDINDIIRIIKKTKLDHIQLHGNEDINYINNLRDQFNLKIIKSIGIRKKQDLYKVKKFKQIDYFLFDYKPNVNELPGGNAKQFNWDLLNNINIDKPWFISGGINIKNITEIQKKLFPYGIDISSGVEDKIGIKSSKKITELINKFNDR